MRHHLRMPLIINGERIEDYVVEHEFSSIKSHYERMSQVSCCERDEEFLGFAKENVTARVLLNQTALAKMPEPSSAAVDEALARLKEEAGGEEQFYHQAGVSKDQEDLIKKDISGSLRVDDLLKQIWGPDITPSEDELKAYYDANQKEFLTIEEIRASHIFKSLSKVEDRQELYNSLREVRAKAVAGENFEALAEKHTDKEKEDIDLGFFKQGDLMDEFEVIAFSLEVGDVSPIFSSHFGFHLAKVTDRKPAVPMPFAEVRDEVLEILIADHRQEKTKDYIEELKTEADIVDREEDETADEGPSIIMP